MDRIGSEAGPYRVGILPITGFALMSYSCTVEPLRAANLLSRQPLYEVVHFADGPRAQSSGAAGIEGHHKVGALVDLDLLLVVAGGDPFAFDDRYKLLRRGLGVSPHTALVTVSDEELRVRFGRWRLSTPMAR